MSLKEIEEQLKICSKSLKNIKKYQNPEIQKEVMKIVFFENLKKLTKTTRNYLGIKYTKKEVKPIPPKK